MDSGASRHVCYRKEWYHNLKFFTDPQKVNVVLGDRNVYAAEGSGLIQILKRVNNKWLERSMQMLFVPMLNKNMFSTNIFTSKGLKVVFDNDIVEIHCTNREEVVA